jgi:phosphatidylglycerol:prolipoprotein diacylglycerol transferase
MHFAKDFFDVSFEGLGLTLKISKEAIFIGSFPIYWYAICIATGFALALLFAYRKCKTTYDLDFDKLLDCVLVSAVFSIIGARAYYVISKWDAFKDNFWSIFNLREGGIAIYGAIIFAFISGYIMCKIKKISARKVFDMAGVGFLIGQGIGRFGNFFNQEAFGTNTNLPWGMYSEYTNQYLSANHANLAAQGISVDPSAPVHPCFLYEFIWCMIGVAVLSFLMKRRKFDGEIFLLYCIWYGTGRFFIEGLRTDSLMTIGGAYRISQIVAAMSVMVAAIILIYSLVQAKKQKDNAKEYKPQFAEGKADENSTAIVEKAEEVKEENKEEIAEDGNK